MFSNGLRSHGIIEESEEIRMDKESIVLGSGDLYCTDFQGTNEAIPDDAVIETAWGILRAVRKLSMHRSFTKQKTIWVKFPK